VLNEVDVEAIGLRLLFRYIYVYLVLPLLFCML